MAQAKEGDTVKIHYTGTLDDGTVFDSSREGDPLEFTLGGGQVIPGFEAAVTGMSPGETKRFTVPADEAYGPYREEMTRVVAKDRLPEDLRAVEVGAQLQVRQENGDTAVVIVSGVTDDSVTLDANHPLAGRDLTFDIEMMTA